MCPPASVYLAAFNSRFENTCASRSGISIDEEIFGTDLDGQFVSA